ncbi:PTS sugar transporter subunit IIA [Bacillus megaterium]|nr:PTS sugar transporter subunit IIA [Priestia megaterium]
MALAHARPEDGVNEMGLSLLITKETVKFSEKEEHNAQLIFSLARNGFSKSLKFAF